MPRCWRCRRPQVIKALIKNGIFATMNQVIDFDTAAVVAADLGFEVAEQTRRPTAEDAADEAAEELTDEEIGAACCRARRS